MGATDDQEMVDSINACLTGRAGKLEAMARAWCKFNGWVPDHRPLIMRPTWGDDHKVASFVEVPGDPIWKAHVRGMDAVLRAIEEGKE